METLNELNPGSQTNTCYICGSKNIHLKKTVKSLSIFECSVCNLKWVTDKVTPNELKIFYEESYFKSDSIVGYRDYVSDEQIHRQNAKDIILRTLKVTSLENKKILDIGCACGFLLSELGSTKGAELFGTEISEYAYSIAKKHPGIRVFNKAAQNCDFAENSFDVVFLTGTIEHLIDPRAELQFISKILKPHGHLIVTTADTEGVLPIYAFKPPEHLFYFSRKNLSLLAEELGYKEVFYATHFATFFIHDFLTRLGNFLHSKALLALSRIVYRIFPKLSFKIPTNEMMQIFQNRKPILGH